MQAVGHVIGCYTNIKTGKETEVFRQKNLILYEGADIMAGLLSGDRKFFPSHMYFAYENKDSAPTAPSFQRDGGTSYFSTLSESVPTQDWLRVPIITTPRISVIGSNYSGNAVTFSASSASSDSLRGESPEQNYFAASGVDGASRVYSVALVSATNPNTKSGDKVFSRLNLSSPLTVTSGHHLTFYWIIKFN